MILKLRVGNLSSILARKDPTIRQQLDSLDQLGSTPLHWAAARSDNCSIEELIRAGANVNILSQGGNTPLHAAISFGASTDTINMLIDWGASLHICEPTMGWLPFHWVCRRNNLKVAERMILAGLDINSQATKTGSTGLHVAAHYDSIDVLKYLVSAGADLEIQAYDGSHAFTALSIAVAENAHKCLQVLLRIANYLYVEGNKSSILHLAAKTSDVETMDILSQHGLAGLDIYAQTLAGLTAEETFQKRYQVTEDLTEAFRRLIKAIEKANAIEEEKVESEIEDVFHDALESQE